MLGRDDPELLAGADLLVKSPGVPEEAEIVRAARSAGIPVWAEVELAYRLLEERNPIVGITGTNGKTTTTLLTAAMLEGGGVPCASAGNVGTALSSFAGVIEPGRTIVCELSSFQLEGVESFRADVGVLLNVTPDHLDRHGRSSPTRPPSCASSSASARRTRRALHRRRLRRGPATTTARRRAQAARLGRRPRAVRGGLRGLEAARAAQPRQHGLRDRRRRARWAPTRPAPPMRCATFAAPAHRLEEVRELRGVRYVNDSKATNVEATLQALASFDAPLHVILGGSLKGADFAPLAAPLAHAPAPSI